MTTDKIKKTIVKFLKDRNMYEDVDTFLIDDLIFNIEIANQCSYDIRNEGRNGRLDLLTDITRDPDKEAFFQKNRLLDIYTQATKNIKDSYVKLGLTPQERTKLKLIISEASDEFADIFDAK